MFRKCLPRDVKHDFPIISPDDYLFLNEAMKHPDAESYAIRPFKLREISTETIHLLSRYNFMFYKGGNALL